MHIGISTGNYGTFQTSGSSLICASGTVQDTLLVYLRGPDPTGYDLTVDKTFTCGDHSGKIFVRLFAHNAGVGETFGWEILGGTGRYWHLDGLGVGSTAGPSRECGHEHVHGVAGALKRPATRELPQGLGRCPRPCGPASDTALAAAVAAEPARRRQARVACGAPR